jgi:hypothetical protein
MHKHGKTFIKTVDHFYSLAKDMKALTQWGIEETARLFT